MSSDPTLVIASGALIALGVYFMNRDKSSPINTEQVRAASMAISADQVHQAMGTGLEGRGRVMFANATSRGAMDERNTQRPAMWALDGPQRNGTGAQVLTNVQNVVGAVNADVPRKTAFIYDQRRRNPINQAKIRPNFQIVQTVK